MNAASSTQPAASDTPPTREHALLSLLRVLSHDVRTPLQAVMVACELLDEGTAGAVRSRLQKSADRSLRVISDSVDYARLLLGHDFGPASPVSLHDLFLRHQQEEETPLLRLEGAKGAATGMWNTYLMERLTLRLLGMVRDANEPIEGRFERHDDRISLELEGRALVTDRRLRRLGGSDPHTEVGSTEDLAPLLVTGIAEAHGGSVTLDTSATSATARIELPRDASEALVAVRNARLAELARIPSPS